MPASKRLSDLGERAVIERVRSILLATTRAGAGTAGDLAALEDDAAILPPVRGSLIVSTDAYAQSTHFPPQAEPRDWGWLAAAGSLSDLAAMGARPVGLLAAEGAPRSFPVARLEDFNRGMRDLCRAVGCPVVGGDTKESRELSVVVTVLGEARRPLRRSGGRPGHALIVTGPLGGAAAAFRALRALPALAPSGERGRGTHAPERRSLVRAALRRRPRIEEGQTLAHLGASAAIDLSDGFALSAIYMAEASDCRAVIDVPAVPRAHARAATLDDALYGSGDYELLAAVPPRRLASVLRAIPKARVVGRLSAGHGVVDADGATIPARGWEHFRS
ncbi:MAG: thiamine-phosphate kinase [Thermoplasmatota archaeon]